MERKFKVGDRVKCVDNGGWSVPIVGKYGRVVGFSDSSRWVCVRFDEYISGQSCSGNCEDGYGWNCDEDMLELVTKETIVIYRKGDEVIALDKVSGKTGVAKCGRNDTFDFATGARIAFERLLGDPKPEKTPLNVKIVFTKGDAIFKTGHIYEIKDGQLYCPGYKLLPDYPNEDFTKFYSIEELEDYFKPGSERRLHRGGWSGRTLEFIVIKDDPKPEEPKPEEPKYFNGKVVCITSCTPWFTEGKIYDFKNGQSKDNSRDTFPSLPIASVADLNARMNSQFLEIKED